MIISENEEEVGGSKTAVHATNQGSPSTKIQSWIEPSSDYASCSIRRGRVELFFDGKLVLRRRVNEK
jgi:hypothetical protein